MIRLALRALLTALVGAAAGAACLVAAFVRHPGIALEMNGETSRVLSGFYRGERQADLTFAWTGRHAEVVLPGLDRSAPWECVVRLRGARPDGIPQPSVTFSVDGRATEPIGATNEFRDVRLAIVPRADAGLRVGLDSTPSFVPGPGDSRELGVQVDRVSCEPLRSSALPPRRALTAAATTGAIFGAAFALFGGPWAAALGGVLVLSAAQALAISTPPALYTPHVDRLPALAVWTALPALLWLAIARRARTHPLSGPARFTLAYSAALLYLLLVAVLHPAKPLVDALFHAHRLEWVMAGRYYFTQPMPAGVSFPYAIALYVVAWPWAAITHDHVTLLRIVVCVSQVAAGACLYPVTARATGSRIGAAAAVVFLSLCPLPFVVIGNANLTNAFGQAMGTATMLAAAGLPLAARPVTNRVVASWGVLFLLASTAFLSHVSTFPLLLLTLVAAAVLYWRGAASTLRSEGRTVLAIAVLAAIFAVTSYYGHFPEVYESLDRVRGRTVVDARPSAAPAAAPAAVPPGSGRSRSERLGNVLDRLVRAAGWPVLVLAGVGAWRLAVDRARTRLTLILIAWAAAYVVFVLIGALGPVEPRLERYTVEFVDRVTFATLPAVAILAGLGAAWLWSRNAAARACAAILGAGAVIVGGRAWIGWLG